MEVQMTDECLGTFMIETEGIFNNRYLVLSTADPNDLEVITLVKLLLLRENVTGFSDISSTNRYSKRWEQTNYLAQLFWR